MPELKRRPSTAGVVAALVVLVVGAIIAVIVIVGPATTENTSSVASANRVPIPGSAAFYLKAQQYSVWYGVLNQGGDVWSGAPPLSFNIDPPAGAAQPGFRQNFGSETNVGQLSIERVAYMRPIAAGRYHISVSSEDGPGGLVLIGKSLPNRGFGVIPGLIVFAGALVIAGVIMLISSRRRDPPLP